MLVMKKDQFFLCNQRLERYFKVVYLIMLKICFFKLRAKFFLIICLIFLNIILTEFRLYLNLKIESKRLYCFTHENILRVCINKLRKSFNVI